MSRKEYGRFCSETRKHNLQPLCSYHNNVKGHRVCDLRPKDMHNKLLGYLDDFGIKDDIVFEDPRAIFAGDLIKNYHDPRSK